MRRVDIYVENQRLELFDNEEIIVDSSVQNISDISSVFTDISQSFTIPCSAINNGIFEHFYNNDFDGTVDHNERRTSRIEIDGIPYRTGKISIEKSQKKNGQAESYSVTFYGDVVTFKDLVGDAKLRDLDYTLLNHDFNGAEVQDRIENDAIDYNVRYPLISNSRLWQYGDASANDISIDGGAITKDELFPAVRVYRIFNAIEDKFGVDLVSNWMTSPRFTSAFLLFKNREDFTFYSAAIQCEFGVGNPPHSYLKDSAAHYHKYTPTLGANEVSNSIYHYLRVDIVTASSIDYYLDTYKDGILYNTLIGNGSTTFIIEALKPNIDANIEYTFKVRSTSTITFSGDVTYRITYNIINTTTGVITPNTVTYTEAISSETTTTYIDLASLAPDMTVIDFVKGIFNTFNLTASKGSSPTGLNIQPLDLFYNAGMDYDITTYVSREEEDIERAKLYKNINFKYQKSQCFLNNEFYNLFNREYGDLSAYFGYDGGDFTIQLPFENILHTKFTDTNIQVGYCLGVAPDYKNYVPKPVLLYMNSKATTEYGTQIKFDNDTTIDSLTEYMPFGQDYIDYTLNFGSEISSFTNEVQTNTLYQTGYEDYLSNLFNPKTRILKVKAQFPLSLATKLNMNDNLIIRDKKYIINEMKQNLTNGDVSLSLISNWRGSLDYNRQYVIDDLAQDLEVIFSLPSDVEITIGTPAEPQFATPDDTTVNNDQIITFTCTANGSGANRTNTFPLTFTGVTMATQYLVIVQTPETGRILRERTVLGVNYFVLDEYGNKIQYE